jgi:ubiquinone/menaquinone biosynthesis C-methylase UbiE
MANLLELFNKFQKNSMKMFSRGWKTLYKAPVITKVIILLCVLIIIVQYYNPSTRIEGFSQKEKFITKKGNDIYDDFYVDIYDDLVYDSQKNAFELNEIKSITQMNPKKSIILDIGCGTGHHIGNLHKSGFSCVGIDKSSAMIQKCKNKYPDVSFKQNDVLESIQFQPNTFTQILSLYFTIYYIQDKKTFFENVYQWLKPGGYLAIHLVNRDKFDPIINVSNPLHIISPQKYAKERITNSVVKFNDFQYKADFKYNKGDNKAYFEETFKDDATGNVRKNEHIFYMETQKHILNIAKQCGFILHGKIDMVPVQYEYQYIYILQKPE